MANIFDQLEQLAATGGASDSAATVEQIIDATKQQPLEPFNEMLPTGVTMSVNPNLTLTPRLDLNTVSPYVQGSAEATLGQQGLLGYNVNAQVPMGGGFTGVGNYGPQGGNVGVNYEQGGLSAGVSAPVSERTDSVKSLLNNITAGFRYTRNF